MAAMTSKQTRREYERLLSAVFGILIKGGMRRQTIATLSARALVSAVAKAQSLVKARAGELTTVGLVLDAWHRDRRYLTVAGKPKAVSLDGKTPSVEALILSQDGDIDAGALTQRIKNLGLIAQTSRGLYRPIRDAALVSLSGPVVLQHLALSLSTLLETVEQNVKISAASPRLLERLAEVPDLPAGCTREFLRFSQLQGSTFIKIMNDWLETRRARAALHSGHDSVRAGVHVYAYVARTKRLISNGAQRTAT